MKPTKQQLIELIEDYAAAKATGRVMLIQVAIARLNQAVEMLFAKHNAAADVTGRHPQDGGMALLKSDEAEAK